MKTLQLNSSGSDVVRLQRRLKLLGFDPGPIDGQFGPRTEAAVKQFQISRRLVVDGIVGEQTSTALYFPIQEICGAWIPNYDVDTPYRVLTSKQQIADTMKFLAGIGCNVVFPVVWNKGYTLFRSRVMQEYGLAEIAPYFAQQQPSRDPLEDVIQEANRLGIKVIPWFEYGFMSSAQPDGGHILKKFPSWWAVNRNNKPTITGLYNHTWMNALDPDVQNFILKLILEVAERYDVDGIQVDDHFGLPAEAGYNQKTISLYRQQNNNQNPPQNSNNLNWLNWIKWRADILTGCMAKLYRSVKDIQTKRRRELLVSVSPSVQPFGLYNFLQDSNEWVKQDIVDIVHPQIYRSDYFSYEQEVIKITKTFAAKELQKFAPAIAFQANGRSVSPSDLTRMILLNRRLGLQGHTFFTHAGIRQNNNTLQAYLNPDADLVLAGV